jgi:hypothetical protein
MSRILAAAGVLLSMCPAYAQEPPKPEHVARLTELIAKSQGPYRKIADGIWETSYKGKNLSLIRIRIATAGDGVFFMTPLAPRQALFLNPDVLTKIAEFNADYDYVKLALGKTSLDLRIDVTANLLDLATFNALESQTALAAEAAYALIKASGALP